MMQASRQAGFDFHQWGERQPSVKTVIERRAEWRERQRRYRSGLDDDPTPSRMSRRMSRGDVSRMSRGMSRVSRS